MSKSKPKSKGSKSVAESATVALNKVKDAGVAKPAQTPKAKSKEIAKKVASKEDKKSKRQKVKEPTPEPESGSDESASSTSASESESEVEVKAKAPAPAKNGVTKGKVPAKPAATKQDEVSDEDSDSSASSESSESSDNEPTASDIRGIVPGASKAAEEPSEDEVSDGDSDDSEAAAVPAVANGKGKSAAKSSDEDESDDSSEETDDKTAPVSKKSVGADQPSKKSASTKLEKTSDEDSEESEESSDTDEESDDDDSEEEIEPKRAASKRKAEEEAVPAFKKAKTGADASASQGTNLFVGSLSWSVDEEWLTREFEEFGELTRVQIITDGATGRSKGFGYVEFADAAAASAAYSAKKGAMIDNRAINLDFATSRGAGERKDKVQSRAKTYGDQLGQPTDTLFIGNLKFEVTEDIISKKFEKYGRIVGVRLPTDRQTGDMKGFGFVTYSSVDEAKNAMESMQGADLLGRAVRLDFSEPRQNNGDSRGRGGRGGGRNSFGDRDRGGFGGGRGGGRGFGDSGGRGGGRGNGRGGRGGSTNRGGMGDYSGKKTTF